MIDLRCGDCLDVLPTLPAESVDVICTDPPYGQSNEGYDKGTPDSVWRECFRVARRDAVLLSFAGNPTYHRLATDVEYAGWKVRQMWAWVYTDGLITSAYPSEGFDRLAPALTPICFATKGKVLLPLEREGEAWEVRFGRSEEGNFSERCRLKATRRSNARGHWPRSVVCTDGVEGFQYFRLSHNAVGRNATGHPNEKPLPLIQWLLGKMPGQVVLDPYCGSGTAAVACLAAGRDFIGIEVNRDYHASALRRIADAQGPLFAPPPFPARAPAG